MQYKLSQLVNYSNDKINSSLLTNLNYISTENMLPNIGGIIKSSNVPLNTNVCKFIKDNILLSNIRPYFHKLYLSTFTGGCSNDVLCFKITNPKIINPKYLYYAMSTKSFIDYVVSTSKGTKMPRGDKNAILEYTFNVASIPQQLLIVDIIGSLDDKIENNNKLYKKIDEYLLLKYKKIQDKTGKGNFKDNFNILNGYAFKSKDYIEFGTYKVITIKNIKSDGFTTASCDFIDFNDDYRKVKLNIGDILLTMTGDVGRVGIVDQENCLLNQRVLKVTGISPAYTYAFLKSNYYNISMISKGSVQQNLSVNDLYNISVYNSKQQIFEFKKYDSLFEKMVALKKENIKLQQLKLNYLAKFF